MSICVNFSPPPWSLLSHDQRLPRIPTRGKDLYHYHPRAQTYDDIRLLYPDLTLGIIWLRHEGTR